MNIEILKKLREETGAGVMEIKEILEQVGEDYDKALAELLKKVAKKAEKKSDRTAGDGLIHSYIHSGGKIGALVHVACETDFVAKTADFQDFCHALSMQICVYDYETVDELLDAEAFKDPKKTVKDTLQEITAKLGEKIEIIKFVKYTVK